MLVGMPRRKTLRLRSFDYSGTGAYFITVCAHRRSPIFGRCAGGELRLSGAGLAVVKCWDEIPAHFPSVELDAFVVMPNHVHGILFLVRAGHAPPLQTVVGSFKSAAAREVNGLRGTGGNPVWQRGYYERVVRSEEELEAIRQYVSDNPRGWTSDPENPSGTADPVSAPWL